MIVVKTAHLIAIQRDAIDNKLSVNDISSMFNEFLNEFERIQKQSTITTNIFYGAVEEITDAVLLIVPRKLFDSRILHHSLIHFLHQLFISLLNKWCMTPFRINIQEMDIFLKIILIFIHIAEQRTISINDQDRKRREDLLITKQFLFEVREQIDSVILNKKHLDDDRNIYVLGLLTVKLLQDSPFNYQLGIKERLIDDLLINSLDSYDFAQVMRQLQNGKPLTSIERYFLSTCWEYLTSKSLIKQNLSTQTTSIDLIHYLSDILLTQLEQALNEPPPITPLVLAYIMERCSQILNIHNLHSFDKHANHIIDHLTKILQKSSSNTNEDARIPVALEALYNLTQNTDIRLIIKKRQLTPLLDKYTSSQIDAETRQLALNILAEIMNEEEINKNPNKITTIFLNQLKQVDPNGYNPDADSALSSFKALMQHEQIKKEFVKQGGLDILIPFIRDGNLNKQSQKQLEDALKILWLSTFNNPQALNVLQKDTKLMSRVNEVHANAKQNNNSSLEKAAEGLIWKVEKEEKFKQQQEEKKRKVEETGIEEEEEQYDCMISYSWADMELAHKIFHHLTEKLGYKVWLDQEQMHGSTIEAMANAVENAQFILMCMSETYKRSPNCQSEAEYAFNQKKHIVPIKMKKDYTADGWLGFILGTRMYIDFGTYEFDKAIELLDNEIQLQKKKRKDAKEAAKAKRADQQYNEVVKEEEQNECDEIVTNMKVENILKWNETVVRDFLMKNDLSDLIPLCSGLNGEELLDLYGMCKSNSVTMYRLLKLELLNIHEKVLPVSTFLHFIHRLHFVNGNDLPLNMYIYNEHLAEYLQDDE